MEKLDIITFQRTDAHRDELTTAALVIAEHFKVERKYLYHFSSLINNHSKYWNIKNMHLKLEEWLNKFPLEGANKFLKAIERAFNCCYSDKDIHILRGLMTEGLIIGKYGGIEGFCDNYINTGWGAKIIIANSENESKTVWYQCLDNKFPTCRDKSTVDYGCWNGYHGHFYECKVQPAFIECKDVQYIKELYRALSVRKLSFEIFFACLEPYESVELRLIDYDLNLTHFKPVGYDTLYKISYG